MPVDEILHLCRVGPHDLLVGPQGRVLRLGRERDVCGTLVLLESYAAGFRRGVVKLVVLGLLQVELLEACAEHDVLVLGGQKSLCAAAHRLRGGLHRAGAVRLDHVPGQEASVVRAIDLLDRLHLIVAEHKLLAGVQHDLWAVARLCCCVACDARATVVVNASLRRARLLVT